jgi:hypothetical protein
MSDIQRFMDKYFSSAHRTSTALADALQAIDSAGSYLRHSAKGISPTDVLRIAQQVQTINLGLAQLLGRVDDGIGRIGDEVAFVTEEHRGDMAAVVQMARALQRTVSERIGAHLNPLQAAERQSRVNARRVRSEQAREAEQQRA